MIMSNSEGLSSPEVHSNSLAIPNLEATRHTDPLGFIPSMVLAGLQQRGRVRLELNAIPEAVRTTDIQGFRECEAAHTELQRQEYLARDRLLTVMSDPSPIIGSFGDIQYTSWHYSEREVPGHDAIPLVHKVKLTIKEGKLKQTSPLTIATYILHRSLEAPAQGVIRFTGDLADMIAFDAYAQQKKILGHYENIQVHSFGLLENEVIQSLTGKAEEAALEPWAKALLELDESAAIPPDDDELREFNKEELPWVQLLTQPRADYSATLEQLVKLFQPRHFTGLYALFAHNVGQLDEMLQRYGPGAAAAFDWLMQNVATMQRQTREAVRHSVAFGFEAAFTERLQQEEQKVAVVAALAHQLNTMCRNVNDCAPEIKKKQQ